ncbi:thymidine kinase, cytosolic [Protobothrops mucrosquamatus]|uniref:thymidine kinase, cytosolic n=1 Tax=Protobothrops mucrosquamatus TaxID=103944 RepID=UPI0007757133|nr:thymidine kinase, cytosolic [Protobothrops mucrosquamatus]
MSCMMMPRVQPGSPHKARGQIQVIFGPMFSGKSTELMRRVRRFQIAQYKCLLIKYAKDTRYCVNGVSTHDRNTMEAMSACCLKDVQQEALNSTVIGIDEGQFFPDIVEFCETMANAGKTVIVAALDGTFQRRAFGNILQLVPLAESVVKLNAVCMECFHEASYTKRLGTEKEVEVIGGADKYHSVCRVCYFKNRQHLVSENKENLLGGNKPLDINASRKVLATRQIMQWNPSS